MMAATDPAAAAAEAPPPRAGARFLLRHPAHLLALGFGSGLAPRAPGTVGTLWAWLAFLVADRWVGGLLGPAGWGGVIAGGLVLGSWACAKTARDLRVADPSAIVWDEVLGFWLVLWLLMPAGLAMQLLAFALFRFFDAVKPGPVGWADRLFKASRGGRPIGWREGFGILFDDLVAAGCTLLVIALGLAAWQTIAR